MNPAIALDIPNARLAGTRPECASPRPAAALLTEPVQPRKPALYEGDARLTLSTISPVRLTFEWTNLGGRS